MRLGVLIAVSLLAVSGCGWRPEGSAEISKRVALPADEPVTSTSIGLFATYAYGLPIQEKVDLCSAHYPDLQSAFDSASAELRKRFTSLLSEALKTEQFAPLLKSEVPQELFGLYGSNSARRRTINTGHSREMCERTLGEYKGTSDQMLQAVVHQFLASAKSIIDLQNRSQSLR